MWRGSKRDNWGVKTSKPKGQALLSCISGCAVFCPSSPYIPSQHFAQDLVHAFAMETANPLWDSGSFFSCQPSEMTCANGIAAPFEGSHHWVSWYCREQRPPMLSPVKTTLAVNKTALTQQSDYWKTAKKEANISRACVLRQDIACVLHVAGWKLVV